MDFDSNASLDELDASQEDEAVRRKLGKWCQPNVPHTGWYLIRSVDHGEYPAMTCEMCETMGIRYEFIMEHLDYPERLSCGRVCAAAMSPDGDEIELEYTRMEREARNAERREKRKRMKLQALKEREARIEAEQQARRDAMSQDEIAAEAALRKASLHGFRPSWCTTTNGNWWTKATEGWRIIVYTGKRPGWKFLFGHDQHETLFFPHTYTNHRTAMAAAELFYINSL